jgi:tripartite-type tricarboxylate transporter receptor subunit TctC
VAPFPAGGSADLFARIVAQRIGNAVGQPVIIEPKPGASGIIGTRSVIEAAPDGYTLLSTSVVSLLVPPSLAQPRAFDPLKDVAPITSMAKVPALLVANPNLGVHTIAELIKYATANPGKVNIGSSGTGTLAHLAAELLKREARIDIFHVPYKGAPPAITDLVAGHVDLMFSDASFFVEHIKAGRLVPLAIAASERIPQLPDVPTTAEAGYPDLIADNTYSLFAPGSTPGAIIEKLNALVLAALTDSEVRAYYSKQTAVPSGMKTEDFKAFIRSEAARWIPLAKAAEKSK